MIGIKIVDDTMAIVQSANRRNKAKTLSAFEENIKKMDRLELAYMSNHIKEGQLYYRDFASIIINHK